MNTDATPARPTPTAAAPPWLLAGLGAALLWSYWPVLREMAGRWLHDPRYSHGVLVPAFALYLVWDRRAAAGPWFGRPSWSGLLPALAGAALMLAGGRYYVEWLAGISLVPSLLGLVLLTGGWPLLRRTWPGVVFLAFMVPLPYQLEVAVGRPLQRAGTLASNYTLQTLGLNSVAEGNVILLDRATIGIVDACNGLGMIFMFSAFTAGAALLLDRPPIDKALILLSTLPIALAANVLRITVTGVLSETVGGRVADAVYHEWAGWLMMPVALAALWLELAALSALFVDRPSRPSAPLAAFAGLSRTP
jgi:exosortase